ncbi:MAG: hypothetical protein ACLUFB_10900 [Ruminococcus sp.]|uniref:hypothetical protein n=1 Tax=Ruminococcus sp. TaxID=41978 RepID=UPI003990E6D6
MFKAMGSKMEIIMQMIEEFPITTKEAVLIFDYLKDHPDALNSDKEVIKKTFILNSNSFKENDNVLEFLIPNTGYYINVKRATIIILATILDYYLTNGFANALLTLTGVNGHAIMNLEEEKLCITTEIIHEHKKLHDATDLSRYEQECINNHIRCSYNVSGICTLKENEIANSLEYLAKRGVLTCIDKKYKASIP